MKYDLYSFRILASEYDLNSNIFFQYSHDIFYNSLNKDEFGYEVDELWHDPNGDMTFYIFNLDDNKLGIRIIYSDKFSKTFIEKFVKSYKLILNEMVEADELRDINYVSAGDVEILDSYNQTECLNDNFVCYFWLS